MDWLGGNKLWLTNVLVCIFVGRVSYSLAAVCLILQEILYHFDIVATPCPGGGIEMVSPCHSRANSPAVPLLVVLCHMVGHTFA